MGCMRVLSESGDIRLRWNPENPEQVSRAKEEFDRLRSKGYLFFKLKRFSRKPGPEAKRFEGQDGQLIAEFSPEAEGIIASPPARGG